MSEPRTEVYFSTAGWYVRVGPFDNQDSARALVRVLDGVDHVPDVDSTPPTLYVNVTDKVDLGEVFGG